jgi:hypothetical protein
MKKKIMKKIISMASLVLIIIGLSAGVSIVKALVITPTLTISSPSVLTGNSFDVPLNVSNFSDVQGVTVNIQFDNTRLTYNGYTGNAISGTSLLVNNIDDKIYINWFGSSPVNINNGALITLHFTAISADAEVTNLGFFGTENEIADSNGDSIATDLVNGSVAILVPSITTVTCPASGTYTGSAITPCTVLVTGAGGLSLTPDPVYVDNINVGTASASYTFTGDASHASSSDIKTFKINAASATVSLTNLSYTYDGSAKTVTVATEPVGLNTEVVYSQLGVPVVSPTAAGSYDVTVTIIDPNYSGSQTGTLVIIPAASVTTVTCSASETYTGSAITPCTVLVTGAGGLSLTPVANYTSNINVGIASASYIFAGDANHVGSSDDKTFEITAKSVTITFDSNGGSAVAAITADYGSDVSKPADPTKTGYAFVDWLPVMPLSMPLNGVTLIAQWTVNQYTITFNSDGGSAVAPITQDFGTAVAEPTAPTKAGYTFAGWDAAIPTTMPAASMTINATWTVNQYTITFNSDGGSAVAPITQDFGTAVAEPTAPTKAGYTFAGWDAAIPTTMPAASMTINATWTVNQYTITYTAGANGSITGSTTQTVNYNTDGTAVTAVPATGYHFAKWSDEKTYNPRTDTEVTGDLTVEASFAIDAVTPPSGGGGGYYIPTPTAPVATTTPSIATSTVKVLGVESPVLSTLDNLYGVDGATVEIVTADEASKIMTCADAGNLTPSNQKIYDKIIKQYSSSLSDADKLAIKCFIQNGTQTTKRLGAGERAGVINSFAAAFSKMPTMASDWQDVVKIANGRWPSQRNASYEAKMQTGAFVKIYGRKPDLKKPADSSAIAIMSYGLLPVNRNTNSEKAAIKTFKAIYHYSPTSALDWNIARAIAYSGAKR